MEKPDNFPLGLYIRCIAVGSIGRRLPLRHDQRFETSFVAPLSSICRMGTLARPPMSGKSAQAFVSFTEDYKPLTVKHTSDYQKPHTPIDPQVFLPWLDSGSGKIHWHCRPIDTEQTPATGSLKQRSAKPMVQHPRSGLVGRTVLGKPDGRLARRQRRGRVSIQGR